MGNWGWVQLTENEKSSILKGVMDGSCHGGPFHVELQPTGRCNLNCFFCGTLNTRGDRDLGLEAAQEILLQLKAAGTRFITLNGGGEPLFHQHIDRMLEMIAGSGLAVDNLTTNGVLLTRDIAELLVDIGCRQVIVSLNGGTPADYSRMMRPPEDHFARVLDNISGLVACRKRMNSKSPRIIVQFLVYKENFGTIPAMYELGCHLGIDAMIFNTITNLPAELTMDAGSLVETLRLFGKVLRKDHYSKVGAIHSFDKDLSQEVDKTYRPHRLSYGGLQRIMRRLSGISSQPNTRFAQKMMQIWIKSIGKPQFRRLQEACDCCLAPWHTLTIRADGSIPACCVLHERTIANVANMPLKDIWYGEPFIRIRNEIWRTIREGKDWKYDPGTNKLIKPMCAMNSDADSRCRFRNDFFCQDYGFLRQLYPIVRTLQSHRVDARDPR